MSLDTYDNLKTAIGDWLDRPTLTDAIDDFIDIAEARHKREVRIREMLTRANLAITDGDRYVNLPSDFLDLKYLRILDPDNTNVRRFFPNLDQLTPDQLTDRSTNCIQPPSFFSVHAQIEFDSEVDQDYTAEIFYYIELDALDSGNQTNALLTRAPDVYLFAALAASAPHLLNDERVQMWESLYRTARDDVNQSQLEALRGGPLKARLKSAP